MCRMMHRVGNPMIGANLAAALGVWAMPDPIFGIGCRDKAA